jgi:ArsR family transcriptional regulator
LDVRTTKQFSIEQLFQALGDTTRLRLLNLIGDEEVCVCYFVDVLRQPQPKISRHLAYLRRAGLVEARREGKWMHYRIVMPVHAGAAEILRHTLIALADEKAMRADRERLATACSGTKRRGGVQGAPVPTKVNSACCEAC